jgi:hypothetical protein
MTASLSPREACEHMGRNPRSLFIKRQYGARLNQLFSSRQVTPYALVIAMGLKHLPLKSVESLEDVY